MTNERTYEFEPAVRFRFLDLSTDQAADLASAIPGSRVGTHHKTGASVGSVELDSPDTIHRIVRFAEKHAVPNEQCDVFVSIFTENDTEIWDVPRVVNQLLKEFDCQLVFSFTSA
jgi:hypothetical protein